MRYVILCLIIIYHLETTAAIDHRLPVKITEPIDLTWPYDNNTLYWGNGQPFTFIKKTAEIREDGSWYSANEFCTAEHGGTHFDAPYHFYKNGWKVGDVPLHRLIVHGITIDLRRETRELKNETLLLPEHLEAWVQSNGEIQANTVILVHFGWSQYYNNKEQYFGIDENNKYHFPGISPAAAEWITRTGKVVGIGVDTPSVDPGNAVDFAAHKIFARNQIYLLENVNIPRVFPKRNYVLYVMPMKIAQGTGAPLRMIAVSSDAEAIPRSLAPDRAPWYGHVLLVLSIITLFFLYATNWNDE